MNRHILSAVIVVCASLSGFGQAPACVSGSLANVLGTACTIGNITFTFQNNFQGFSQTTDLATNTTNTMQFGPDAIDFMPVSFGSHAGFQLIANFLDSAGRNGLSASAHAVNFAYSAQVNGAFEIIGESAKLAGRVTDVNNDTISSTDGHCFTNGECIQVAPEVSFDTSSGASNHSSISAVLGFPALGGIGFGEIPAFTTAINSSASLGDTANLNSVIFLYKTAPQIPLPPPAKLRYKNIDLPGQIATFPFAINNHGDIAGNLIDLSNAFHGYVTDRDGNHLTLVDFPGATDTTVAGMNDRGDIVGQYVDSAGTAHGFSLIDGSFSTVDFPLAIFGAAEGINDRREIVGTFQGADVNGHSYRFSDGVFTQTDDPNTPPDNPDINAITDNQLTSINNHGKAAGFFVDLNDVGHSFLLSGGVFHPISVAAAVQGTFANGLSDLDEVVGTFVDIFGIAQGFLLSHGDVRFVNFPNAISTSPNQINSSGHIVGIYTDAAGSTHGFFAEKSRDNDAEVSDGDDTTLHPTDEAKASAAAFRKNALNACGIGKKARPNPVTRLLSCNLR